MATYLTRLKPEAKGIYSASTAYEANSLVTSADGVRVYLSVKDAPAGTPLTDTNYFVIHTDLTATVQSVEAIREGLLELARGLTDAVEASGNPVQLELMGGIPFDIVETTLEPIQEGSGDPSPDNIRPISGWTEAKLARYGGNLLPAVAAQTVEKNGITFTSYGDGSYSMSGTATAQAYVDFPVENVTLPDVDIYVHIMNDTVNSNACIAFMNPNNLQINFYSTSSANRIGAVSNLPGSTIGYFRLWVASGQTVDMTLSPMLRLDGTETEYEAHSGDSFTAEFGDTIYGGTLNWTTGLLTVTHGFRSLNGTEGFEIFNGRFVSNVLDSTVVNREEDVISSHYPYDEPGDIRIFIGSGSSRLEIYDANYSTADEFNAYLAAQYAAGTPVQIVYKLATPTTIQLTAREIRQLAGTNTLYGDGTSLRAIFNASASSPVDTNLSTTSSNPVQNKTVTSSINSLKSVATASSAGLMSATDKSKLDTITTSADSVSFSQSATSGNKVGTITINGTAIDMYSPIQTTISGNAATATKVSNVLTIQANGSSLGTFDGSSAKTFNITYSNVGAAASSHGTHVSYGTSASALGTSSAGSASTVSRSDHVHALPALTSCTGTLTIAKGGTGATSAANARSNLGIKSGTTLPTSGSVGDIFFLY